MKVAKISVLNYPITANVSVPGSKSYSLRALFISALCENEFKLKNLLDSADVTAMKDCLKAIRNGKTKLFAYESGITMRFLTALCCIKNGTQTISGAPGLNARPIKDLVDALRSLGAEIEYLEKDGFPPLKVSSSSLLGSKVSMRGDVSSQYVSALLLIAPTLKNGLTIEVEGRQDSKPFIDMTIDTMEHFDIEVENQNYQKYIVKPQKYQPNDYEIEADYSSASYFFAINKLTGSKIKVEGLKHDSKQADKKFVEILEEMDELKPIEINMNDSPDQAMTMAVLCAFADGKSIISGIGSLRVKETERIKALENELGKMGIATESNEESLTIFGGKPRAARIDTYGDHRIAMAFAIAATKIPGMEIMNPGVVSKTFPGFWEELSKITDVAFEEKEFSNIVLVGMRGSGKSTIGKLLSERLSVNFVDADTLIETEAGQPIQSLVKEKGWDYFRKIENKVCEDLAKKNNFVIASGGGMILNSANRDSLTSSSIFILLKAGTNTLLSRIKGDKNRIQLTGQPTLYGEINKVWNERKDKYFEAADFIIDTEINNTKESVEQIIAKINW